MKRLINYNKIQIAFFGSKNQLGIVVKGVSVSTSYFDIKKL